ncbi:hypothetical protein GCWU000342_00018 [Shuttleworthella satelles DSM 14600]|uniref:Uncharacterized protein n=1 Tax=Shuttleworthella satelles DSM 14600 TaxID=626523 RepID=C4GA98_9FIRM|nr:hypothetical protein GCWU000342_00018 [Shuttleworthia satelles DSM 14600]
MGDDAISHRISSLLAVEGIRLALIFIIKKEEGIYKGDKYPINGIG